MRFGCATQSMHDFAFRDASNAGVYNPVCDSPLLGVRFTLVNASNNVLNTGVQAMPNPSQVGLGDTSTTGYTTGVTVRIGANIYSTLGAGGSASSKTQGLGQVGIYYEENRCDGRDPTSITNTADTNDTDPAMVTTPTS